jgi:hypothetical protein
VTISMLGAWNPLLGVAAAALREERLQAHWAAQPLAAFAHAVVPPRADDSHTSLEWLPRDGLFRGQPTADGRRVALDLAGRCLLHLDPEGNTRDRLPLAGQTLDAALAWLGERYGSRLVRPDYDMPEHPVASGAAFAPPDPGAAEELARWYGNALALAEAVRREHPGASAVRCWPHHFDLATLITLKPGGERTIGVGLSPGDPGREEPYFYVTPWPPQSAEGLPSLDGDGLWHTEGWVGAVLPASRIGDDAPGQVERWARSALAAGHALLRAS